MRRLRISVEEASRGGGSLESAAERRAGVSTQQATTSCRLHFFHPSLTSDKRTGCRRSPACILKIWTLSSFLHGLQLLNCTPTAGGHTQIVLRLPKRGTSYTICVSLVRRQHVTVHMQT